MHRRDPELEFPPFLCFFSGQEIQIHLHATVPDKQQMLQGAENESTHILKIHVIYNVMLW